MLKKTDRRGAVIVWMAVSMVTLIGFGALAVDIGYMRVVKGQLQNAADAAALAGATALWKNPAAVNPPSDLEIADNATKRAQAYAAKNIADNIPVTIAGADIKIGHIEKADFNHSQSIVETTPYNVIQVIARRDAQSDSGPVYLFLSHVWGDEKAKGSVSVIATAYLDNHTIGVHSGGGSLIPVFIKAEQWDALVNDGVGEDNYGYDEATGLTTQDPDGIREINLYPEKQHGDNGGGGNFKVLNFADKNLGTGEIARQIREGLSDADFLATPTIQSTIMEFFQLNEDGVAILSQSYVLEGNPGLSASIEAAFNERLGDVVGFFIVTGEAEDSGSNAEFNVTGVQFGRILFVDLNSGEKKIMVQPAAYTGDETIPDDGAPGHDTAVRVFLIR